MSFEKVKLFVRKLFWTAVFIAVIILDLLIFSAPATNVKIINDTGVYQYDETLDRSICSMSVEFDDYADMGSITVAFRDVDGKLISEETEDISIRLLSKNGNSDFYINGEVKYYEIISYSAGISDYFKYEVLIFLIIVELIFILPMFITTLLLSCKIYYYEDWKILVYAGHYHHYIKVDGVKTDELNTLSNLRVIYLSCTLDDGTYVDVAITSSNRITLKIDNRLYR